MTLRIEFDRFVAEHQSRLPDCPVYLSEMRCAVRVTSANAETGLSLVSDVTKPLNEVRDTLKAAGLTVWDGSWLGLSDSESELKWPFVGAVAYRSADEKPGIWVDAYLSEPSPAEVLKKMYDELRGNGELEDVAFEEFLRLTHANVVVVSPTDLNRFANNTVS